MNEDNFDLNEEFQSQKNSRRHKRNLKARKNKEREMWNGDKRSSFVKGKRDNKSYQYDWDED
jgi:hypothetical protein